MMRSPSRITWAAVLLASALPLACGARQDEAAPAAAAAMPASIPAAALAAAAGGLPAELQGQWQALSKALVSTGDLRLSADSLQWAPCGPAPRRVQVQTEGEGAVRLSMREQPACQLDGQDIASMRVAPVAGQACQLEISLYDTAGASAQPPERLAWGVMERQPCAATGTR